MKYIFALSLVTSIASISLEARISMPIESSDPKQINKKMFGDLGLQLSPDMQETTLKLISLAQQSSPEVLFYAAAQAQAMLEKHLEETNNRIKELKKQNIAVSPRLFFEIFALKQYIDYVKTYQNSFSLGDRTLFYFHHAVMHLISYTQEDKINELAKRLYQYFVFELHEILMNYHKLLSFLHHRTLAQLPSIMDAWSNEKHEAQLKRRAKHVGQKIKIQAAVELEALASTALADLGPEAGGIATIATTGALPPAIVGAMLKDALTIATGVAKMVKGMFELQALIHMGFLASLISGTGLSIQWVGLDMQKRYQELIEDQQKIVDSFELFQKQLQIDQKQALQAIGLSFKSMQEKLNKEYKTSSSRLHQEIVYLNQSINLDQPQVRYLMQPISWDRYFESSVMLTPDQKNRPWFNVFGPFNQSNWLFIATAEYEYFAQLNNFSLNTPFFWQQSADKKNIFTNDPATYSIFTEWATEKQSYEIEVDCILAQTNFPFFMGIIFNRGRWISGDPERLWWYRAFGMYSIATETDSKKTIKVGFAQQILELPKSPQETEKIISPLEQIMGINDDKNKVITIDITQPLYCTFKVLNEPSKVTLTLVKKDIQKNTESVIFQHTVDPIDSYIFKYHGIGFIAAGCQASFNVKKPLEIVYSKDELDHFRKEVMSPSA